MTQDGAQGLSPADAGADWRAAPRLDHAAAALARLPTGGRVADIGCGKGDLVRALTRGGLQVVGVETQAAQIARAQAATPAGDERYVLAGGQALPFEDASLDGVVYCFSLHHVPLALMDQALAEVARCLRPGGVFLAIEPVAAGDYFQLCRPVHDETQVRAAAQAALERAPGALRRGERLTYVRERIVPDLAAYVRSMVEVDPRRLALWPEAEAETAALFERLGEPTPAGKRFLVPVTLDLFTRV